MATGKPGRPKKGQEPVKYDYKTVKDLIDGTPGVVTGDGQILPDVWLPKAPAKKGTVAYREWAKACFETLVEKGYNFTQAAERIGLNYRWWTNQANQDPDWAEHVRTISLGGVASWDLPDLSKMSFQEFMLEYAPYGHLPEHHDRMAVALQDPKAKLVMILGHPESAKSTIVSLWYVLYRIAQNPDIRIALVSKSSTKAQDLLNRIKRYLTEEQLYDDAPRNLIKDFNGWRPAHGEMEWSSDQIFVKHRQSGERDPTVQALGIGKQIYGARLDLLILDDALVLDNQISELQRERLDQWFTNEARSRAQRGQTVVNGTRLFPFDLYGQWKKSWKEHPLFRLVTIPAIIDEYTEEERPNWPEYWTLDGYDLTEEGPDGESYVVGFQPGLRDIRSEIVMRDAARWRLVYQQEDVEETENVFRQDHIDRAFDLGSHRKIGQVYDHEILILGIDPATTGRAASVLLAVDPDTRIRTVVDIFVGSRLGATGIRNELIYRFWDKYRDKKIDYTVIETNFAPTLMGDEAFLQRAESYGTAIVNHKTTGRGSKRGSKWDEEFGIGAMASLFGNGLVAFAGATPEDRAKLEALTQDMLVFPWADEQDALVALWVANGEAGSLGNARMNFSQQQVAARRGVPDVILSRQRRTMAHI